MTCPQSLRRLTAATLCFGFLSVSLVAAQEENALAKKAQDILKHNCYRCHGQNGSNEGGFNFVLRAERLTAEGKFVTPGDADGSYLLERITTGEMPPKGKTPRPSKAEIESLKKWIDAGAPPFEKPAERDFIKTADVIRFVLEDLKATRDRERKFVRYLTLTHLFNAGFSDDELQTYRLALAKLVNSLSWNKQLIQPKPIDPARTVLRIDLRDLKWNDKVWEWVVQANHYGIEYKTTDAKTCYEYAETTTPWVRADWFVSTASRPPLYHQVLQVPDTATELERTLHVDVASDIRQETVVRAGFNRSGVSQHNRLIERHETPYGAYWKSYDFGGSAGRKNIFSYPMGPGTEKTQFQPDGGELIFSLPNGLQGYMLVDGAGRRIDKGPTSVVSDPKRPDKAVMNGISCMSCHYAGIIKKFDEVRQHVETNRKSFPEANDILAIYAPKEKLEQLLDEDAQRYQAAVERLGLTISETGEPVVNMALRFEEDLDLRLAAAEFGMQPSEFTSNLNRHPQLGRSLGVVNVAGGSLKRDALVAAFPEFVEQTKIGVVIRSGNTEVEVTVRQGSTPAATGTPSNPNPRPRGPTTPSVGAGKAAAKSKSTDPKAEDGTIDDSVLSQLLIDLKSSDGRTQKGAAERLQKVTPPKESDTRRKEIVSALITVAKSSDPWAPNEATKALATWATKDNVPELVKLLQEKSSFSDIRIRKELLPMLGSLPDARSADAVAGFLTDFHSRSEASNALKRMGSVAEKPVAKFLVNQDQWVRQEACKILKDIGTKNSLNTLVTSTKDKDGTVARMATDAVREINSRGGKAVDPK